MVLDCLVALLRLCALLSSLSVIVAASLSDSSFTEVSLFDVLLWLLLSTSLFEAFCLCLCFYSSKSLKFCRLVSFLFELQVILVFLSLTLTDEHFLGKF